MNVYFIAEIGNAHNGSLARALDLIDAAASVGCNAVKFQLYRVDKMFAPAVLEKRPDLQERRKYELPLEWLPELRQHSTGKGLEFGCSPGYLEAVDDLMPYVDWFKVGSYELCWDDLLQKLSTHPTIISTGMADCWEIERAVSYWSYRKGPSGILYCVSQYPCEYPNLGMIDRLRDKFNVPVGWSDHSANPDVVLDAIYNHGAEIVEFHFDLDEGVDYRWTPDLAEDVIDDTNPDWHDRAWRRDSDGYRPMRWAR